MSHSTSQQNDITKDIDKHLSRSGWGFLIVVVGLLFLFIYLLIPYLRGPNKNQQALEQRISQLESRLDAFEIELSSVKE